MGKLDEFRRVAGGMVDESAKRPPAGAKPLGLDPTKAVGKPAHLEGVSRASDSVRILVDRISPDPDQPRTEFDEESLGRLAESLKVRGQLQPIRVRWDEQGGIYRILCGERRWRAARMAGLTEMACVIQSETLTPDDRLTIQLIENALREDLKPVEQARAYRAIMDRKGYTTRDLAAELSVSQSTIVKAMSLLTLAGEIQNQVESGELASSIAYEISKAPEGMREVLADRVVVGGLTHKGVVDSVRKTRGQGRPKRRTPKRATSHTIKTDLGPRITIEYGRGLDEEMITAALTEALSKRGLRISA